MLNMTPSYWNRETQYMFFWTERALRIEKWCRIYNLLLSYMHICQPFNITTRPNSLEICKCVVIVRTTCRCRQRLLSPKKSCMYIYIAIPSDWTALYSIIHVAETLGMLQAAWLRTFLSFKNSCTKEWSLMSPD